MECARQAQQFVSQPVIHSHHAKKFMSLHLKPFATLGKDQQKDSVEHIHLNVCGKAVVGIVEFDETKAEEAVSPARADQPGESIDMKRRPRLAARDQPFTQRRSDAGRPSLRRRTGTGATERRHLTGPI